MFGFDPFSGWWQRVGAICALILCLVVAAPAYGTALSSLDSDPGIEQTEVPPEVLEEINENSQVPPEEVEQIIEEIQSQIQEDLQALQTATDDASSAVSDLLQHSQEATRLTAQETWDEVLDQLLKWKVQAQLRTRQHIQFTRQVLENVGNTLEHTLDNTQETLEDAYDSLVGEAEDPPESEPAGETMELETDVNQPAREGQV